MGKGTTARGGVTPVSAPVGQLAKLLGLLGSSFDGEVVSAARKAHALLIANDWTWQQLLTNGGASALTEEQIQRVYAAGLQKGEQLGYDRGLADGATAPPKGPSIKVGQGAGWISGILEAAAKAQAVGALDSFETDFSNSIRTKIERFGASTFVSQRQLDSLTRLETKMKRLGHLA
jgi:hypothetical protein